MKVQKQKGFTIIELMVVVAIISILATMALAAYANFTIRSKVAEGLGFATEAKTAVTSYYSGNARFPLDYIEAGLTSPTSYNRFEYISRLEVNEDGDDPSTGIITVSIKIPGLGADNKLQLVPTEADGILTWICRPSPTNGLAAEKIPANCRS